MPLTYVNSMSAGTAPFAKAFRWVNDPAEDSAFLALAIEELEGSWEDVSLVYRNLAMDRSGAEPTVRWEFWDYGTEYVGPDSLVIGTAETYWSPNRSKRRLGLGPTDMDFYFECDQYGRAFSIDDLVVPGPPAITGLTGSVSSARELTLQWQADAAYAEYEVHEFLKVPESTLKATVAEPTRTSGSLAANQTLQYAVRGKTAAGELGPFSSTVLATITSTGGTVEPGGEAPA